MRDGKVTEGTSSNVYMVKDGSILTTPLSNRILPGITRMAVERIAGELQIPFIEAYFTPEDMLQADEVFITSTTSDIMPAVRIDDENINGGKTGPVARTLNEQLMTMMQPQKKYKGGKLQC